MGKKGQARIDALVKLFCSITSEQDCKALLEDLCTAKELDNMAERCHAAALLLEGKTYAQVMEEVDISSATLSRVSRCVQYGRGYSRLLK
jgi:TrpR-related protein YerC/YecD